MRRSTPRVRREPLSIARWASRMKPTSSAADSGSSSALLLSFLIWRRALEVASAKRTRSASTPSGSMMYSGTWTTPASTTWAGPIAMPLDTPTPRSTRSGGREPAGVAASGVQGPAGGPAGLEGVPAESGEGLSDLIELALDQLDQGGDRSLGLPPIGAQGNRGAGSGGQHHQAHDRLAGHGVVVADDLDLGIELRRQLDELGRRAGMQAALVA